MDYEKKYKEALERASKLRVQNPFDTVSQMMEHVFPELKENEDEKIRKEIIKYLEQKVPHHRDEVLKSKEWIAWPEKQNSNVDNANKEYWRGYWEGKQVILDKYAELEKQGEQKTTVIIPKFRVGDNIKTTNEEPLTITKIDEKGYWSDDLFICGFDDAAKWELVEQKPAAWSENDEYVIERLFCLLNNEQENYPQLSCDFQEIQEFKNWLKSLKDKVQPKQ